METIRIVHTNDVHSHFENWPKIKRYLLAAQKDQSVDDVFSFDLGDFMDRSHPLTDATDGQANIALLDQIGLTAATIGNNEGVGNSHDALEHLYDHANFDVILGNLFEPSGDLAHFAKPYKIVTTKKNTRIAILGFTAPYPLSYEPNGWKIKLVSAVLPQLLTEISGQYDVLILLSHLGIGTDRLLADQYPEINLIIGSHTHHLLPEGEKDNQTFLAAAGKYGENIGDILLTLDDNHQIVGFDVKTIKTSDLPVLGDDAEKIANFYHEGNTILASQKIADLPGKFADKKASIETGLRALADFAKTRIAILNTGLFLGQFHPGILTKKDLHQVLPHPMHIVKIKLSGVDLWRVVMEMEKNRTFLRNFPIKGMSFRGKIFGEIVYLGIEVDPLKRLVKINGQEIDPDKKYEVAILDHYVFIPYFPTIEIMAEKEFFFPLFFRDVVGQYLQEKYPLKETN